MKTRFVVDSGTFLVIDPAYLKRFARHFKYDEFARVDDQEDYIVKTAKRAFPRAEVQLVGLAQGFGGDGDYELIISPKGEMRISKI